MPRACEKLFYSDDTKRKRYESLVNYIARERVLFRELEKRVAFPEELKGDVPLRESKLREAAWDTVEHWTEGACDFDVVREKHRKLERPLLSGKGGHRIHGMSSPSHFVGYQRDGDAYDDL
eukprot:3310128-Pyramimonas_sp.AAC.1